MSTRNPVIEQTKAILDQSKAKRAALKQSARVRKDLPSDDARSIGVTVTATAVIDLLKQLAHKDRAFADHLATAVRRTSTTRMARSERQMLRVVLDAVAGSAARPIALPSAPEPSGSVERRT